MDIYQEEILEHYRHPHHSGSLPDADVVQRELNPLCGDRVTFYLKISADKVADVSFEGEGCAISQASASMLTDEIIGKTIAEIQRMRKEAVLDLLGIELGPTRLKCALLPLQAISNALEKIT